MFCRGLSVRLGEPQDWDDLDLSSPEATALLKQRNNGVQPTGRIVTPAALLASDDVEQLWP
jgi:hypothetical protein